MNPYEAPDSESSDSPMGHGPVRKPGLPCIGCGSLNTGIEQALRTKPSIVVVLFFGWIFILMRTAFSKQTETCRDCGHQRRYRSTRNHVALVCLILIVLLFAAAIHAES